MVAGEVGKSWLKSASCLPVVGSLVRAFLKSRDHQTRDMAASTVYFSFFSLFPLLLGVIAGGSFFLDSEEIRSHLDRILKPNHHRTFFVVINID